MKWVIVLTGVSDFFRPAEKLSLTQNGALTATGTIWTRWCLIIKPKNYLYRPPPPFPVLPARSCSRTDLSHNSLAAVNFALAIVGTIQVSRILAYRASEKGSVEGAIEASKADEKSKAEGVKEAVTS